MDELTSELPIVGYGSRLSVGDGERIAFMVSTAASEYAADLVRLRGPGLDMEPVDSPISGRYAGRVQALPLGSYMVVDRPVPMPDGWRISAWIRPTAPGGRVQAIAGWGSTHGLFIDDTGRLGARAAGTTVMLTTALRAGEWHHVVGRTDPDTNEVVVERRSLRWPQDRERAAAGLSTGPRHTTGTFSVAAAVDEAAVAQHYDGKIEAPQIQDHAGREIARWDFADAPSCTTIRDRGPLGLHGRTVNHPQRAMTGHGWRGDQLDFRVTGDQHGAISFHRDDLSDARWETDFALDVNGLPSGVYAVRLQCDGGVDHVPFFVHLPIGTSGAQIALVLPTYSYVAYGNERHWWVTDTEAVTGKTLDDILGPADRWAATSEMVSLYDHHSDGTGNCYASYRRPLVNIRPDYRHPLVRGPHQLSADLYLVKWLNDQGYAFDVLTDEEVHHHGAKSLRPYKAVLTGTHPEYPTEDMLDAYTQYIAEGGGVMYLGGNGFYWVTSVHPEEPHVIEVRRGHSGSRPWESEPGEWHHSTTGEPGGLWRYRGRSPHTIFGTGTAGFAFGKARPFARTEAGADPAVAWIFDGVERPDCIGDFGDVMSGAGGFEFDRHDPALGSPPEAVVVASAENFDELAGGTVEETLVTGPCGTVRADLVLIDYPQGGTVFSASSAAWGASLLHAQGANDVSRITANVLDRLLG